MSEQLHHLSIDLETYSTVSIGAAGSYRYILDPSFEILLFAYSLDGMPVEVIDVASGQVIPLWLKNALKNPLYIKHAYNAAFEWFALSNSIALPQWYYVLGGIADRLPDNATLGSLFDGIGGFPYVWAQLHAGRKELCVWASEIEEFPIAVTKKWFPEVEDGKLF